jgi:DNA gyrase subunit B
MQELITRGHVFVAQPPLYRIKKGKSEKYIKDDKEFTREILRRATENVHVLAGEGDSTQRLEGGELRQFLMQLDEFQQIFDRLERRLRDGRVVEVLANPALAIDSKSDFSNKEEIQKVAAALKEQKLSVKLVQDEEHSTWGVTYHAETFGDRTIGYDTASNPEYKRLRFLARTIEKFNRPPFRVVKEARQETLESWRGLIAHLKSEGTRDCSVQRYKGLGEMNPDQLWDTTMNAEARTLLEIRLEDAVESEQIFSTLMGEDVESRRKFIEENALDVRNLDV